MKLTIPFDTEMPKEFNLDILAREWTQMLQNCQYAGELVVPEPDIGPLSEAIKRDIFSLPKAPAVRICVLVLAVNCMYYYHDEQGFWIHFCRLLDVVDDAQTEKRLGKMLESQLLKFNFLSQPRIGPFRYVSPLKEHCGITQQEIPRFANFLSLLSEHYGWDGIRILERELFNRIVSNRFPTGHLMRFLHEDSGWNFTREVARNISQYHRNVLTIHDLENLRGYRTRFFTELFNAFSSLPISTTRNIINPPLPRLIFLPEYNQVALSFDPQAVNKRAYKYYDKIVSNKFIMFDSESHYELPISVERCNSANEWSNWNIPGWNPKRNEVALFHIDRGYFDYSKGVSPGKYYMLAPYNSEYKPPDELRITEYGVDLPFRNMDYDAWLIDIDESTNISFLGLEQSELGRITEWIRWDSDSNCLPGAIDLERVFVNQLPRIKILRPDLFISNAVGLFVDNGREVRKIEVGDGETQISLDLTPPARGRIWAEPIGRMREFAGLDTLGELLFCLFPECSIGLPSRLHKGSDQPEILLISNDSSITLDIKNAVAIDEIHKVWKMEPEATIIEGDLKCNGISVQIVYRIFRAAIRKQSEKKSRYILKSDFNESISLIAAGYPKEPVIISLLDRNESLCLGELGIFNDAGECRFTTYAIRDALARYQQPVGLFAIESHGKTVETETLFLDCEAICQWIADTHETPRPSWWSLLPRDLEKMLSLLLKLKFECIPELPSLDEIGEIPPFISNFFKILCICGSIMDDLYFYELEEEENGQIFARMHTLNPQAEQFLSWYSRAKKFCNAEATPDLISAENLINQYGSLIWKPPFRRWQKEVEALCTHLNADRDIIPLLEEWREDVNGGYGPEFASRIARQRMGRDLTHAWIRYRNGNFQGAIYAAKPLISLAASPVADLAAILLRICWFRLAYFQSQPQIDFQSTNTKLAGVHNEMNLIISYGAKRNNPEFPAINYLTTILPTLPLSEEDSKVLKIITEPNDFSKSCYETDWLCCYFSLRLADQEKMTDRVRYLSRFIKDLRESVPASPDKNTIIDIINNILEKYLS